MSVRRLLAATLLGVLACATPAAAEVAVQPAAADSYLTAGRLWSLVGVLLGLVGVVVGGLALARATAKPTRALVAIVVSLAGAAVGALVVAAADGGPGTGYGIVGGYVALVIGLVGVAVGGLATARSRRAA